MKYTLGLCKGRHSIPVENYIFSAELNPTDFQWMTQAANAAIPADADHVNLYITGLTAATLAVVSVCESRKIGLTAYHYDRESGEYLPQDILLYTPCAFCGKPMSVHDWACPHCGAT